MKRIFFTILFVTVIYVATAQNLPPNGINYQAIARDINGNYLQNQIINVRFTVISNNINGTPVYQEVHSDTTNSSGLFNLIIGDGTAISGDFSTINWGSAYNYLKVELEMDNNGFIDFGTTPFLSVPYALYAKEAKQVFFSDGSATQPSITFEADLNTGIYRLGSDKIAIANGGVKSLSIDPTSMNVHKDLFVGEPNNVKAIRRLSSDPANSWEDGHMGNSQAIFFTATDFVPTNNVTAGFLLDPRGTVGVITAAGGLLAQKMLPKGFIIKSFVDVFEMFTASSGNVSICKISTTDLQTGISEMFFDGGVGPFPTNLPIPLSMSSNSTIPHIVGNGHTILNIYMENVTLPLIGFSITMSRY